MSFVGEPISGHWWIADDGTNVMDAVTAVRRGPRKLQVRQSLDYQYRVYRKRTDGSDGAVLDPDSEDFWDDPMEGEPQSSTDWMVRDLEMEFNPDTGMVEMVCTSVKVPADWQRSSVISTREYS